MFKKKIIRQNTKWWQNKNWYWFSKLNHNNLQPKYADPPYHLLLIYPWIYLLNNLKWSTILWQRNFTLKYPTKHELFWQFPDNFISDNYHVFIDDDNISINFYIQITHFICLWRFKINHIRSIHFWTTINFESIFIDSFCVKLSAVRNLDQIMWQK